MAGKLHLEVASPEGALVNEEVEDVQAPAVDGYIRQSKLAPLVAELDYCVVLSACRSAFLTGSIAPNRLNLPLP